MKNKSKIFIFSVIVIVVLIICALGVVNYLQRSSDDLAKQLSLTQKYVLSENWNAAYKTVSTLNEDWHKKSSYWALFINHHEIDEISVNLKLASQYVIYKQKPDSLAYLSALDHYITHIPKIKEISFENIF